MIEEKRPSKTWRPMWNEYGPEVYALRRVATDRLREIKYDKRVGFKYRVVKYVPEVKP